MASNPRPRRTEPHRNATREKATRRNATRRHEDRSHLRVVGAAPDVPYLPHLRRALRDSGGWPLVGLVGAILDLEGEWHPARYIDYPDDLRNRIRRDLPHLVERPLLEAFLATDLAETTAALHVMAAYGPDAAAAERIREELTRRRQPMPPLLTDLTAIRVVEAHGVLAPYDDELAIVLVLVGPAGTPPLLMCHVDHNRGMISSAWVAHSRDATRRTELDDDLATQVQTLLAGARGEGWRTFPLDLADVRARLEPLIDHSIAKPGPPGSETWPSYRALLRRLCRELPAGGTGYTLGWDLSGVEIEAQAGALAAELAGSPAPDGDRAYLTPGHRREMLRWVLAYALNWGVSDPWRWSPTRVGYFLRDDAERCCETADDALALLAALEEVITAAGARKNLPAHLVEATRATVRRLRPEFFARVLDRLAEEEEDWYDAWNDDVEPQDGEDDEPLRA